MKAAVFLLLIFYCGPLKSHDVVSEMSPITICEALENLDPGMKVPVILSGVYAYDYLYDPKKPLCATSVQPSLCVQFHPAVELPSEFKRIFDETSRVSVVFQGTLSLPQKIVQDSNEPVAVRLSSLSVLTSCSGRFRAKLVVESIVFFESVPDTAPLKPVIGEPAAPNSLPIPIELAPPKYPGAVRVAGVQGKVLLDVTITGGEVTNILWKFGDRVLVREATACVRSWKFDQDVDATLPVSFEFKLERYRVDQDRNLIFEMRLPTSVKVIGPSWDW